jgi:predicted NBD/HSP70 family sugar kinase
MVIIAICYIQKFMQFLGIDIGGTSVKASLVDEKGRVLESRRALTITDDINGFLSTLTELVREFQKTAEITAIGIGIPGLHSSQIAYSRDVTEYPCP